MTTPITTYSFNTNISILNIPSGTCYAYFSNTDPTGWVICDGQVRTNNTDGKYNTLATMGIGIGGTGTTSYTPPDLRGAFLRGDGKGTATTTVTTGYGIYAATLKSSQNDSIKNHVHTGTTPSGKVAISDPGHHHYFTTYNDDFNCSLGGAQSRPGFYQCKDAGAVSRGQTLGRDNINQGTNFPIKEGDANLTDTGHTHGLTLATNTTSVETKPYNFSVNWIIKL